MSPSFDHGNKGPINRAGLGDLQLDLFSGVEQPTVEKHYSDLAIITVGLPSLATSLQRQANSMQIEATGKGLNPQKIDVLNLTSSQLERLPEAVERALAAGRKVFLVVDNRGMKTGFYNAADLSATHQISGIVLVSDESDIAMVESWVNSKWQSSRLVPLIRPGKMLPEYVVGTLKSEGLVSKE